LILFAVTPAMAEQADSRAKPTQPTSWDPYSDTWVATDALGRSLPTDHEVGDPRPDRFVGIFYFLWHGQHIQGGPYDISKILARDPHAMSKPDSPLWGPMYAPHHWGESIFGYYRTDDPYVLRKHAQMLANAGVDMVLFDVTNQVTYRTYYMELLKVFAQVRRAGNPTPQIAFLCPFWNPGKVVAELYRDLYQPNRHADLWFRWEGKPLILADPRLLVDEKDSAADQQRARAIRNFFTFRKPQPDYFRGPTQPDMWSWLEVYPQHVFRNARGEKEQMSVGVAQNAVGNRLATMSEKGARGRSYHGGKQSSEPGAVLRGYNVAEQWARAIHEDPKFVLITGWNEWFAGRFGEFNGVRKPVMFVDTFDQEHSRDIEPMRGGHGDNYYYQMIGYIRQYKGVRPLAAVRPRPIRIDGRFDDWQDVGPEFRDTIGDPAHRDHAAWKKATRAINTTGRNDLVLAKVSSDATHVFFYIRTRQLLTPHTDHGWMLLLIDSDHNPATGWMGYDRIVNRLNVGRRTTSLESNVAGSYAWRDARRIRYRAAGRELELAIPRDALGMANGPAVFDFKWADNIRQSGTWQDFTRNGDVAPNDRFNYRARLPAAAGVGSE